MAEHQNVVIAIYRSKDGTIVMIICFVFEVTWGDGAALNQDGFNTSLDTQACFIFRTSTTEGPRGKWRKRTTTVKDAEQKRARMEKVYDGMVDYIEVKWDQHEAVRVITEYLTGSGLDVDNLFEWGVQNEITIHWIDFKTKNEAWRNEIVEVLKTRSKIPVEL